MNCTRYLDINGTKLYFVLDASGQPIEVSYKPANSTSTSYYFYVHNLQGDVIAIVDTNGNTVVQYTYDAWGNIISPTGSMASTLGQQNPFRYRSYVYDTETGLYYLQSRYYNPQIGRFINADAYASTGQGILGNNMFAYCLNNPVNYSDKHGQIPDRSVDIDGDGVYDYYVYEFECIVVYTDGFRYWTRTHTAEVYVFVGVKRSYFENSDNIPKGFDAGYDLLVADIDEGDNVVFYAHQAQIFLRGGRAFAVDCLLQYDKDFQRNWGRTKDSLLDEWTYHMLFGGRINITDAENIEFDTKEEGKGFGYYFDKAVNRIIDKVGWWIK